MSDEYPAGAEGAAGQEAHRRRDYVVSALVLLWVVPAALFFFIRFSFVFYAAYHESIQALFERLLGG